MKRSTMCLYALPDPHASDRQWERYYHEDLDGMDALELWQEKRRVEHAIAHWPKRDELGLQWLLERLVALLQQNGERGRGVANGV